MLKISIPKPCHEDWNAMTPNERGRHCNVCSKIVVDFAGMDDDAVMHYFLNSKEGSTCGRFKQTQLSRITISLPAEILQIQLPRWKQFLAACLLAFSSMLFSCDAVVTQGEPADKVLEPVATMKDSLIYNDNVIVDTLLPETLQPICTTTVGNTIVLEGDITGDIEIRKEEDTLITRPLLKQSDMSVTTDSIFFKGVTTTKFLQPDSIQTKNPPAADSIKCDANSINYL